MNHKLSKTITSLFIVAIITGIGLVACNEKSVEGMLIVTKISTDSFNSADSTVIPNLPGAELIAVSPKKAGASEMQLTPDFYSACSPHLSYDAKRILFMGQKNRNDSWQVWEMNLNNKSIRKLTDLVGRDYIGNIQIGALGI